MIRPQILRGAVGVVVLLAMLTGAAVAADRDAEIKARQAFAAGRYDKALEMFAQLYAETLHPVYLRNIGRCHQKMREPQKAIDAFHDYLAKAKKVSADERKEIDGYIKEMEALREEQARAPKPPEPPPAAPPPPPAYVQAQPGYGQTPPPYMQAPPPTAPPPSSDMSLTAYPPPPEQSHPFYTRWWFWTAVGVVAVGGIVAAVALSGGSRPPCGPEVMGGCK